MSDEALKQIDESTLTTTCIIFAFALMQQAVAIACESIFFRIGKRLSPNSKFRILFCDRFELVTKNKLNENVERMIGNFFLSFNMSIGICLIIGYFLIMVGFANSEKVLIGLILLFAAAVLATIFRMSIAEKVISENNRPHKVYY